VSRSIRPNGRNTYGGRPQRPNVNKQQIIAIVFVLLMVGSSVVAGAVSLF
jgi:hypothetical protein